MNGRPGRIGMLLLVLFLLYAGPAAADHVRCGDTITQDTTLDSDLICTGDGLSISGGDVTLDLAGHTIKGSSSGVGVAGAQGDVAEVRGGRVTGFREAIFSDGPPTVKIDGMRIDHNGRGVSCWFTPRCDVVNSVFRDNTEGAAIRLHAPDSGSAGEVRGNRIVGNGLGLWTEDYRAMVTDNRITGNIGAGAVLDYISLVTMTGNLVADNAGDGVVVNFLSHATIDENRIIRNGGSGIRLIGDFFFENTSAVIRGNDIARNRGDGVLLEAAESAPGTVIERNRADRNGDDGIDVQLGRNDPAAVDVVVGDNRSNHNADLGIHASPGTTDGGANRAKHNGNPAQCVGVSCR